MAYKDEFLDSIQTKVSLPSKKHIPEELLPHYRLILSIIAQAIVDKDIQWLKSESCARYCHLVGLDPEAIRMPKGGLKRQKGGTGFVIFP